MVKRHMRNEKGVYVINNKFYKELEGSRAQVFHGNAYKTPGGLTIKGLIMNKSGRIVSLKKHKSASRVNRLVKAGYVTKKGKFGCVTKDGKKCTRKKK